MSSKSSEANGYNHNLDFVLIILFLLHVSYPIRIGCIEEIYFSNICSPYEMGVDEGPNILKLGGHLIHVHTQSCDHEDLKALVDHRFSLQHEKPP